MMHPYEAMFARWAFFRPMDRHHVPQQYETGRVFSVLLALAVDSRKIYVSRIFAAW